MPATIVCLHCAKVFESARKTRKFCSVGCSNRAGWIIQKTRTCRHCGEEFTVTGPGAANRQHCSKECAKNHSAKIVKAWIQEHPEKHLEYRTAQKLRDPLANRERWRVRRGRILDLLGGCCVVCGASNPSWLHVDFIPTGRGTPYRHPRHYRYVAEHLDLFRILCANHHYELTLTGAIEGTDITQ